MYALIFPLETVDASLMQKNSNHLCRQIFFPPDIGYNSPDLHSGQLATDKYVKEGKKATQENKTSANRPMVRQQR